MPPPVEVPPAEDESPPPTEEEETPPNPEPWFPVPELPNTGDGTMAEEVI
jgi:hypothetical protein